MTLIKEVARAIRSAPKSPYLFDCDPQAKAAIAVVVKRLNEPSGDMLWAAGDFDEPGNIWQAMLKQFKNEHGLK
jgi:hypothetical protein